MVVGFSNREAARIMTEHLLERGCRRIVFATFPTDKSERARSRLAGHCDALARAGVKFDRALVVETQGGDVSGATILGSFIDRRIEIDGFFGTGDMLALGAAIEARRRGLAIPRDLAIASFDDHDMCKITDPPLTSLKIPRYEIGRQAARLIVEIKVPISRTEEIIRLVWEVEKEVDTVVVLGVGARCNDDGDETEVLPILERLGYRPQRAKTNIGLGRITNAAEPEKKLEPVGAAR